jgi:hypothetical protein
VRADAGGETLTHAELEPYGPHVDMRGRIGPTVRLRYQACIFKEIAAMDIPENKLKEILTEQRIEFQHVVGIFKEDLESKINLIAEQYPDIKTMQKTHTEMIGSVMEDVQIVKSEFSSLKSS